MIVLYTKPVPLNQKYGLLNGRLLLQKKYRDAKESLALEIKTQWKQPPLTEEVAINLLVYLGTKRKIDIDAYLKIILDAAEGVVYENDNQVTELHVYKDTDIDNPRIEMSVI